jgi:hypothetical protein
MASTRSIHAWAKWKAGAGVAFLVATTVAACSSQNPAEDGTGSTVDSGGGLACGTSPRTDCPCSNAGQTVACGSVKETFGNYVICAEGSITCTNGAWSQCVADRTTIQSTGGSISLQNLAQAPDATTGTCANNPCDPTCQNFSDNPTGVDGGPGLTLTDAGGWTLSGTTTEGGACTGYQCNIPTCGTGTQVTLTGTVYDPAGLNPLYHAQVYVPAALPLPPIPQGAQQDPCGGGGNLPPSVAYALTGPNGQFSIGPVPASSSMSFPLVVQIGKWRRQFTYNLTGCQTNPVAVGNLGTSGAGLLLPSTRNEGPNAASTNMPHIGIVTGWTDSMECLLERIGISTTEFCNPGAGCAVDYYQENGMNLVGGTNPDITQLLGNTTTMAGDDLIMLPCEGGSEYGPHTNDGTINPATGTSYSFPSSYGTNLVNYTNAGGRLFTSHWGRQWIEGGDGWWSTVPFAGVANWVKWTQEWGGEPPSNVTGVINNAGQTGSDFNTWMVDVGAASGGPPSTFAMSPWRVDTTSIAGPSTLWVSINGSASWSSTQGFQSASNAPADFTFNTPLNAATTYGKVMYTDMHLSYASSQCGDANENCFFPTNCTTSTLSGQEKAAEFLLFDLQGCTTPLPPPPPQSTVFTPSTFTRDYQGVCGAGQRVVWHLFSWNDSTPTDSSGATNIVFTAFTADTEAQLGTQFTPAASLATATGAATGCFVPDAGTPACPDVDTALTAAGVPTSGQPPYASHAWLRVNMLLNPTPDQKVAPVLNSWNQGYDCVASE